MRNTARALVLTSLALAGLGATASDLTGPNADDAWMLLSIGDFAAAKQMFDAMAKLPDLADQGQAGRLIVAWSTGDRATLDAALTAIDLDDGPLSRQVGALFGSAIAHVRAPPLVRAACAENPRHLGCIDDEIRAHGMTPRQCHAGCGGRNEVALGMTHGGRIPVVLLAIDGRGDVPFVLDTAADLNVMTPWAASRLGVSVDWDATGVANVFGGKSAFPYAVADVRLGGHDGTFAVANVPFAVLSGFETQAYGEHIGGVVNPFTVAGDAVVGIDLRRFRLVFDGTGLPVPHDRAHAVEPLVRSLYKPMLLAEVAGRPARPLTVDSAAASTRVSTALEELGDPFPLHAQGNVGTDSLGRRWTAPAVDGRLRGRAQSLQWWMDSPLVDDARPIHTPTWQIGGWGRVGTDFLLGRDLWVDTGKHATTVAKKARFPDLAPRDARRRQISGKLAGEPFVFREEVVSNDGTTMRLALRQTWHGQLATWIADIPYSPENLYRWGRPDHVIHCGVATQGMAGLDQVGCDELFQPIGGLDLEQVSVTGGLVRSDPDRDGLCVDETSDALLHGGAVTIDETRCYADPWVVEKVRMVDVQSGDLLLQIEPIKPGTPLRPGAG